MLDRIFRLLRHRWMDDADRALSPAMLQRLTQRVAECEARHGGEIRVCIEAGLPNSYLLRPQDLRTLARERALAQFSRLRVWDTEHNNGVLIYLLLAERAIELVADRGINRQVAPPQWQTIVQELGMILRQGQWEEGLTQAIEAVSAILAANYGHKDGTGVPSNELPDRPALY